MSLHRSLKTQSGALNQHRNVLTRAERISKLSAEDRFDPAKNTALGIVKVRSIKVAAGKKAKKADEGTEGAATAAAPAGGAKGAAAGAKAGAAGAKPAAGAAAGAAKPGAKPAAGGKK